MNEWNALHLFELTVTLTALAGCFISAPIVSRSIRTVRRLKRDGINGRLLSTACLKRCVDCTMGLVQLVLVLTCCYRLANPMDGHFVPSLSRLILSVTVASCCLKSERHRRRYQVSPNPLVFPPKV